MQETNDRIRSQSRTIYPEISRPAIYAPHSLPTLFSTRPAPGLGEPQKEIVVQANNRITVAEKTAATIPPVAKPPPPPTPGPIQYKNGNNGSGNLSSTGGEINVGLGFTPTAGNCLVMGITVAASDMVPSVPSPWVLAFSELAPGGSTNVYKSFLYYYPNCTTTSSFNFSCTGTYVFSWSIAEFSGVETVSPLDQTATTSGTGQSVPSYSTPATSEAVELAVSFIGVRYGGGIPSGPLGGFTVVALGSGGGLIIASMAYLVTMSIGAVSTGWTAVNQTESDGYCGGTATFLKE